MNRMQSGELDPGYVERAGDVAKQSRPLLQ